MRPAFLAATVSLLAVACARTPSEAPGTGASSPRTLTTRTATLETGAAVPALPLRAHDGTTVEVGALHEAGPAVVVFYRGHW